MTLPRAQVDAWAAACAAMGNEVADSEGFVSVRALLRRFDAEIVLRPLLVEAMLCEATDASRSTNGSARWRLLIDSEKYTFPQAALDTESSAAPLPSRFRNTVAHELTHSLAYRAKEFGVDLTIAATSDKQKASALVEDIEHHTEALSPLLLAPDRSLEKWFKSELDHLTANGLAEARLAIGVSRFVLLQRLNLLRTRGDGRMVERRCFHNVAVGVGNWTRDGGAVLNGWPIFVRFDGNEPPAFIHALRLSKTLVASSVVDDPTFVLNGGSIHLVTLDMPAGTEKAPGRTLMRVELLVESTKRRVGGSFFFVARRV